MGTLSMFPWWVKSKKASRWINRKNYWGKDLGLYRIRWKRNLIIRQRWATDWTPYSIVGVIELVLQLANTRIFFLKKKYFVGPPKVWWPIAHCSKDPSSSTINFSEVRKAPWCAYCGKIDRVKYKRKKEAPLSMCSPWINITFFFPLIFYEEALIHWNVTEDNPGYVALVASDGAISTCVITTYNNRGIGMCKSKARFHHFLDSKKNRENSWKQYANNHTCLNKPNIWD